MVRSGCLERPYYQGWRPLYLPLFLFAKPVLQDAKDHMYVPWGCHTTFSWSSLCPACSRLQHERSGPNLQLQCLSLVVCLQGFIPNLSPIFSGQAWERGCSQRWRKALESLKRAEVWLELNGMLGLASTSDSNRSEPYSLEEQGLLVGGP